MCIVVSTNAQRSNVGRDFFISCHCDDIFLCYYSFVLSAQTILDNRLRISNLFGSFMINKIKRNLKANRKRNMTLKHFMTQNVSRNAYQ